MAGDIVNLHPDGEDEDPLVEVGVTGLEHFGGRIHEEFLPQLHGRRGIQVFKEMRDNDPTVGAMLFAIEMLIRQVEWRVEPASEDPADVAVAEFVDGCFEDMSATWDDTLSDILSMLTFGFAPLEEVYKFRNGSTRDPATTSKFDDGRVGWRKLPIRAQETIERWIFDDETNELLGLVQVARPSYRPTSIPISKLLLFRPQAHKANPEGRSMLRNAYRPWFFKKRIEEIEGIGVERDLAGLPTALVPPKLLSATATAADRALLSSIEKVLRNVRRDEKEGLVFPMARDDSGQLTYEFKLMSTGGRRQFDTTKIIDRYDRRIAQTMLADFILLGQEGRTGSFALAESKTQLFAVALGGYLDAIAAVFNRFAIPRLLELNTFAFDRAPELQHGDIESVDIDKLGDFIVKLSSAGVFLGDEATVRHLRMQAGLPEPDPEHEHGDIEGGGDVAPTVRPTRIVPPAGEPMPGAPMVEPGAPAVGDEDGEPAADIAAVLLNGAQVNAVTEIITQVGAGLIPKASAKAILIASFGFAPSVAGEIIDPIPETAAAREIVTGGDGG